ncbi:MAG: hypothetical protein F6J97_18985, partial [Leptolyngbya sp. SIO4C1]|nr:hypothetical protein [Leptolyngbya sp. SIO4C1]
TIDAGALGVVDKWMLARLGLAIDEMDAALEAYNFHAYAEAFYRVKPSNWRGHTTPIKKAIKIVELALYILKWLNCFNKQ